MENPSTCASPRVPAARGNLDDAEYANGGGIAEDWQWGYGLTWLHPDPDMQLPMQETFDQRFVPADDAARTIVRFVKEQVES